MVLKRIAFLDRGLQWTTTEVPSHAVRQAGDRAAAKPVLDAWFALMREIFQQDFLALNVAAISWGEGGYFRSLGWKRPCPLRRPAVPRSSVASASIIGRAALADASGFDTGYRYVSWAVARQGRSTIVRSQYALNPAGNSCSPACPGATRNVW